LNSERTNQRRPFSIFVWFTLAYNLLVVLYGAFVRATGSGAGCGSHWPLCNGVVIPLNPTLETTIEFVHRLTSGIAFLFVLVIFLWSRRIFPEGSIIRLTATIAILFMIMEALVGAALVLFGWVAEDTSTARVMVISTHLANTLFLLAALALTGWFASSSNPPHSIKFSKRQWPMIVGLLLVLVLSMIGAVTALGDTLFPTDTLEQGFNQDLDPNAHFIIQIRIIHPILAILTAAYLTSITLKLRSSTGSKVIAKLSLFLISLFGAQLLAGMINLLLLAPIWMQLVHLFLADLVWINLVILIATNDDSSLTTL
jgi:heme A synthase